MSIYKKIHILIVVLIFILGLVGCTYHDDHINIIVPMGSAEYATVYLDDYDIDVVNGVDPLVAAFGSSQYDIIIAPTNLGAKFYHASKDYQLVASIVWGNYYLISRQSFSISDLDQQVIHTFGQNQTPDIILTYVLSVNSVNATFEYASSSLEVSTQFIQHPDEIYFIAEPALSTLMGTHEPIFIMDIQMAYQTLTGSHSYPQASVFAKSNLSQESLMTFKDDISDTINMINDINHISQTKVKLQSDLDETLLYDAIIRSHLQFIDAYDAKPFITAYFELILNQNAALIGDMLPDISFYR